MMIWEDSHAKSSSFMSFMGRAFGARDRRLSDAPPLEKVLADLHDGEQESDDSYAPAIERREPAPAAPPPVVIQDHRERLEKLLDDAHRIAQLLEKEAAEAALAENLKLDEKLASVAKLAEAEKESETQAFALAQQSESAATHRAQIDTEVGEAQRAVSAAEDSIKQLEARLAEAQNVVIRAKSNLVESEGRAHDAALQAAANAAKVHEANDRVTKCRESREAAEAEVREAKAIARSVMQTAATLKQLHNAGSNGLAGGLRSA
jgi:chromosome segregation ATPase